MAKLVRQKPSYTEEDVKEVLDNPEWTEEDFARARPASEVLGPAFMENWRRSRGQRGPQKQPTKQLVSLRIDRDIIEKFKSDGPGWQSRLNETLRKALAE
jgi:uncharacterized protein (DUF4415 family)